MTGPMTFSAGNWFAVIAKDNNLGTVIGEPTGNAPSSYGDILDFQMPRTEIPFSVSYKRWIRPDPRNDPASTLNPHILVHTTIEDIFQGRHPQLDSLEDEIGMP